MEQFIGLDWQRYLKHSAISFQSITSTVPVAGLQQKPSPEKPAGTGGKIAAVQAVLLFEAEVRQF